MNNLSEQVGRQFAFIQDVETKLAELRSGSQPAIVAAAVDVVKAVAPIAVQSKTPDQADYPAPWANANPRVTVPFMMRLPEELHGKLTWLKEHMPNTSIQKIVRAAIEKEVEKLLQEHYKS